MTNLQPFYVDGGLVTQQEYDQKWGSALTKVFKASDLVKMLKERIEEVQAGYKKAYGTEDVNSPSFRILESLLREVEGE